MRTKTLIVFYDFDLVSTYTEKVFLPGNTKATNPKTFFNPVMPRTKGKNNKSFNLNSFRISSIGINIFFKRCLSKKINLLIFNYNKIYSIFTY